jgi:response regulator RpfG family c-di-GMP phosphodiesterase
MSEKKTILYVDDELLNLELFKALFQSDYRVLISESPIDALKIIDDEKVDLILTDQKMPEMTGVEFLIEVHKKLPDEPPYRILTTGYAEPDRINEAFDNYKLLKSIPKPWDIPSLKKSIEEVIGN